MNEEQKANLVRKGLQETDRQWEKIIAAIEGGDVQTWPQFVERLGYDVYEDAEPLCYAMVKISDESDTSRCFDCVLMVDDTRVCHPEWCGFNDVAERIKYGWVWTPRRNWRKGKPDLLARAKNFSGIVKLELGRTDSNRALVVSQ